MNIYQDPISGINIKKHSMFLWYITNIYQETYNIYQEHMSKAPIMNIYREPIPIPNYIANMYQEQISKTYTTKYIDQEPISGPYIKNIYQAPISRTYMYIYQEHISRQHIKNIYQEHISRTYIKYPYREHMSRSCIQNV